MAKNRVCTECGRTLPIKSFWKASAGYLGRQAKCINCTKLISRAYTRSKRGRATRAEWANKNKCRANELRVASRKRCRFKNRKKNHCRQLVGWAIRNGLIKKPKSSGRSWHNRWDFHHADYSRPFYGCWVTKRQHNDIEHNGEKCPPLIDHEKEVVSHTLKRLMVSKKCIAALLAVRTPSSKEPNDRT